MSQTREQLEQELLDRPFDESLRSRYAQALFDLEDWSSSLKQYRLLIQQTSGGAALHLCAAQCCARLDDDEGVSQHLAEARRCDDFDDTDPALEQLVKSEDSEPQQGLRVMTGGKTDLPRGEVISISSTEKVRFSDVIGMEALKKILRLRIIEPFVNPGLFERFKKNSGGGVLLYGPPGCGKTMMAKAIATECEASFTAVGISDILNMWMGESERNLAAIFGKARDEAPSVLFFDELDALAYSRSKANSDHTRTLVNEFLAQLDGMSGVNSRVLILAATNMPWDVDEAMKRPGRFDRQVFVPPPDAEARTEMFRLKLTGVPADEIDWNSLGDGSNHYSGADIDGAIDRAKETVLAEIMDSGNERNLRQDDLSEAVAEGTPTTLEWLKTARNLVKFGGGGKTYKDVEKYLRGAKLY